MKREVRTIIKTALDKITAFVLSVLAAFSFAFGGDVLVEAGDAYSNWWTSPTPDNVMIEEYVENASINKENSKIKDFHDYALNVTKLEIALRDHGKNAKIKENSAISQEEFDALNGKLAGLVDNFDYIIPVSFENSKLIFHAVKNADLTSYIFDLSSISNITTNDGSVDFSLLMKKVEQGQARKADFTLNYKTPEQDKNFYNFALKELQNYIMQNDEIKSYLQQGYDCYVLPHCYSPYLSTQFVKDNKDKLEDLVIRSGQAMIQLSKQTPLKGTSNSIYSFNLSCTQEIILFNQKSNRIIIANAYVKCKISKDNLKLQKVIDNYFDLTNMLESLGISQKEVVITDNKVELKHYDASNLLFMICDNFSLWDQRELVKTSISNFRQSELFSYNVLLNRFKVDQIEK